MRRPVESCCNAVDSWLLDEVSASCATSEEIFVLRTSDIACNSRCCVSGAGPQSAPRPNCGTDFAAVTACIGAGLANFSGAGRREGNCRMGHGEPGPVVTAVTRRPGAEALTEAGAGAVTGTVVGAVM